MTFLADGPGASIPLHSWWFHGPGASSYSDASDFAFMTIFWYSVVWFIALFIATAYFCVKYRRKAGLSAEASPQHNTKLELIWTVLPSLTLVVMFVMGFRGYSDMLVPKGGGIECDLLAQKWSWSIKYPTGGSNTESTKANVVASTSVPIYYFPEETPVKFRMISKDVMHAFWIPDFRAKVDIMPNRYTKYWFESGKIPADAKTMMDFAEITHPFHFLQGVRYVDHTIHCAEYCGDFHSDMAAVIRIIPKDAFAEWLKKGDAALPPVDRGQRIWESNCQTCHSIDGSPKTGPSWKNMYGRNENMSDGSSVLIDDNYIRESIYEPQKKIVAGFPPSMPTFAGGLDSDQINALIAFMKSKSENVKEEADPADAKPDAKPDATPASNPGSKPAETPKPEPKK